MGKGGRGARTRALIRRAIARGEEPKAFHVKNAERNNPDVLDDKLWLWISKQHFWAKGTEARAWLIRETCHCISQNIHPSRILAGADEDVLMEYRQLWRDFKLARQTGNA